MKNFLSTFLISFVMLWLFLFFGGTLIFENLFALLVVVAFVLALLISGFVQQDAKMETLEARLKALEETRRDEEA